MGSTLSFDGIVLIRKKLCLLFRMDSKLCLLECCVSLIL